MVCLAVIALIANHSLRLMLSLLGPSLLQQLSHLSSVGFISWRQRKGDWEFIDRIDHQVQFITKPIVDILCLPFLGSGLGTAKAFAVLTTVLPL